MATPSKKKSPKSTSTTKSTSTVSKVSTTAMKNTTTSASNERVMPYQFEPYQWVEGEEYMNDKQRQHFRNILETWKQDLMKEVDHTIVEMKGATVLPDPNDRATQEEAFNLELRTRDRERKLIRKIEEALQQIDDKEYGYCESCGVEIGIRRLEARPTAVLCIDCKTLDEIRERTSQ